MSSIDTQKAPGKTGHLNVDVQDYLMKSVKTLLNEYAVASEKAFGKERPEDVDQLASEAEQVLLDARKKKEVPEAIIQHLNEAGKRMIASAVTHGFTHKGLMDAGNAFIVTSREVKRAALV